MRLNSLDQSLRNQDALKIIAVGAHLDDIELACGGTLAKAVHSGHQVKMLIASDSTASDCGNGERRTKAVGLREGTMAANIIGVEDVEILDFPDRDIPYNSKIVGVIEARINDIVPDIVFTHWPFDTHQDHRNVSLATISAARYYNTILMYEPITPSGRSYVGFRSQVYVDITGFIEPKIKSLSAHVSQYQKYGDRWLDAVKARAQHRGYEIGVEFAESFEVMRYELTL